MGMAGIFRPYAPNQQFLLPPSPQDWLPDGHLAHFIADTVDHLDLSSQIPEKGGQPWSRERAMVAKPDHLLYELVATPPDPDCSWQP